MLSRRTIEKTGKVADRVRTGNSCRRYAMIGGSEKFIV